jgi:outer membrane protein assembly factor BamB
MVRGIMRLHLIPVITFASAAMLLPVSVSAERLAPKPVPPIIYEGVEYRAPLDNQMGHVQAVDMASGRTLWETKVYNVKINPALEEDVQLIFITDLRIQDGKILVRNEAGKTYRLDPKTGRVDATLLSWLTWLCVGILLLVAILFVGKKLKYARH